MQPILTVKNLQTSFRTDSGIVTAVDDVSFELYPGQTLGIVGESGCGKTVTSKSILKLLPEQLAIYGQHSQVLLGDQNLLTMTQQEMQSVRGKRVAMIFQEPMTALNPVFTIGWQLEETLKYHSKMDRAARKRRMIDLLKMVEISNAEERLREYPHQLSGGMRQRVMIAIALACEPDVLIADEPTTALDVTIQAQILRLMSNLKQQKKKTATLLITHDLGVVAQVCDHVLVMYAGQVVESATAEQIFAEPKHPYTRALLDSMPGAAHLQTATSGPDRRLRTIEGVVPSLRNLPNGCRFHDRCECRQSRCEVEEPGTETLAENRTIRCHYPLDATSPTLTEQSK